MLDVLVSATTERPPGDGEVRVIAALVNITSRKRTEAALEATQEGLRHAQKMEAIGQLTGGIAHDFNNVLQAVSGNLELIRRRVRDDRPDAARMADYALEAAGKAAGSTPQFVSFSRSAFRARMRREDAYLCLPRELGLDLVAPWCRLQASPARETI
jgi:C4-dicarboxylate-specific signal transduction histidine kinase